jgi:hypothetical protein
MTFLEQTMIIDVDKLLKELMNCPVHLVSTSGLTRTGTTLASNFAALSKTRNSDTARIWSSLA